MLPTGTGHQASPFKLTQYLFLGEAEKAAEGRSQSPEREESGCQPGVPRSTGEGGKDWAAETSGAAAAFHPSTLLFWVPVPGHSRYLGQTLAGRGP